MRILPVLLFAAVLLPRPATSATFVVDSTADVSDAAAGDGLCATADGACTLRAAVEETNALPGHDAVQLAAATYRLTSRSALEVTDDLAITAPDGIATISGFGVTRVLHFTTAASGSLHDVVVHGGFVLGAPGGAGILNEGFLVLADTTFGSNGSDVGAAVHNTATGFIRLTRSLVSSNSGPVIVNDGVLVVDHSSIERNGGVAIVNHGSTSLAFTGIDYNDGGIANVAVDATVPDVTADRCTLVGNRKRGALENSGGTVTIRRSTVSDNEGAQASAVLHGGGGTLALESVTIAANGTTEMPAAALDGDGTGTVTVRNSILAGNASDAGDPDCRLTVTSLGTNLTSCPLSAPDPTTLVGDPRLAPVKEWRLLIPDSDERTLAQALLPGSPAIDAGSCDPMVDQRGTDRPAGAQCDIGAFESTPLCRGGVAITGARVGIRQSGAWTTIKVRGALSFTDPLTPVLDPLTDGVQLRVDGDGGTLLERTELTDPLTGIRQGCEGWRAVRPGTRFAWRGSPSATRFCLPGNLGRLAVSLEDQRPKARGIALKAQAKLPRVEPGTAVRVTIVLAGDPLGGSTAGANGACAAQDVVCTSDPNGTRFDCR